MVFDLDKLAVGGPSPRRSGFVHAGSRLGEPENFTVINPRMAGDDAVGFARLQQNSRQ